jgi:hypothetical protein
MLLKSPLRKAQTHRAPHFGADFASDLWKLNFGPMVHFVCMIGFGGRVISGQMHRIGQCSG